MTFDRQGDLSFRRDVERQALDTSTSINDLQENLVDVIEYAHRRRLGDWGVKVQTAHDLLPATGGVIDATGLYGNQTCATPVILSKPCKLITGPGTITANNGWVVVTGDNVSIEPCWRNATFVDGTGSWADAITRYGVQVLGVADFSIRGIKYRYTMTGTTTATCSTIGILLTTDVPTTGTVGCTNFLIEDCDIELLGPEPSSTQRYLGIFMWTQNATFPILTKDGVVRGNRVRTMHGRCIEPAMTRNVTIADNLILNAGTAGTIVSVGIRTIGNENLTIVGNTIEITGASLANSDGIQVNGDNVSTGVTIVGNSIRTSAGAGTGIKIGGNASKVNCAGNTVLYTGTTLTNMFGILVTFNPPASVVNAAGTATANADMIAVHDNLVAGFVSQISVKRADAGDPYPTKVSFIDNHLGPMWNGTAALGNFMDFPTAEVLSGSILVRGNWVPSGVSGMVEQFLGTVRAPALQGGLTNPAAAGELRFPSTGQIRWRNNANSADVIGLSKTSLDYVQVGASNAVETHLVAAGTAIVRARATGFSPGATDTVSLGEATLKWAKLFLTTPGDYANDGAAASGGVAVGQVYRNGSILMIRVA